MPSWDNVSFSTKENEVLNALKNRRSTVLSKTFIFIQVPLVSYSIEAAEVFRFLLEAVFTVLLKDGIYAFDDEERTNNELLPVHLPRLLPNLRRGKLCYR